MSVLEVRCAWTRVEVSQHAREDPRRVFPVLVESQDAGARLLGSLVDRFSGLGPSCQSGDDLHKSACDREESKVLKAMHVQSQESQCL